MLQLFVLQRIEGRRRTRVILVLCAIWAVSWSCLGLAGLVPGTFAAAALVVACAGIFGLGETLLQPTIPAITNDLSPDHLRGRYNADHGRGASRVRPSPARRWRACSSGRAGTAASSACCCSAVRRWRGSPLRTERRIPAAANGVLPAQVAATERRAAAHDVAAR